MIINSQRTIYSLELQLDMLIKGEYTPRPNTTLNEKFNYYKSEPLPDNPEYRLRYIAIGVGGEKNIEGVDTYSYSKHSPTDAGLFDQIPFVLRPVDQDLPQEEQVKYRFKQRITLDGTEYYRYMLKVIRPTDIITNTYRISLTPNSTGNLSLFTTNDPKYLSPTPRTSDINLDQTGSYISKMAKVRFALPPSELEELNNVIRILYPSRSDVNITEIGLCGGVEKDIDGELVPLHTQIYFHIGVNIDTRLAYDPTVGYLRAIEIGGSEPLYDE